MSPVDDHLSEHHRTRWPFGWRPQREAFFPQEVPAPVQRLVRKVDVAHSSSAGVRGRRQVEYSRSACRAGRRGIGRGQQRPAAEARMLRHRAALGDLHRAILELGNLPERIEHGVGQHVRCRLVVAERYEHRPPRRSIVRPRIERDAAAARSDGQRSARFDAQIRQVERVNRGDRLGLDVIQVGGAALPGRITMFGKFRTR